MFESDNWGVEIDLGGREGKPDALDLGELSARHVLLQAGEVGHARLVGLKMRVRFPGLSASEVVDEVDVLKESEIGDDWLGADQELPSVFKDVAELTKVTEGLRSYFCTVILTHAQFSVGKYGFHGD